MPDAGRPVFLTHPDCGLSLKNQVEIGGFVDHFGERIEHGCPSIVSEYPQLGHAGSSRVTTQWGMCIEFVSRQAVGVVDPHGNQFTGEIVTLILFGPWNPSLPP